MRILKITAVLAATLALSLGSCRKENGILNDTLLQTPYSLYAADASGAVYNTNDGESYRNVFAPDGFAVRSLLVAGRNILFAKGNLHLSANEGMQFAAVETTITQFGRWQNVVIDVPQHKRLYVAVDSFNSFSVKYSEDSGKTWKIDAEWASPIDTPGTVKVRSFTLTKSGILYAYDPFNKVLIRRRAAGEKWTKVDATGLPGGVFGGGYFLGHLGELIFLGDFLGNGGVIHSTDSGRTWTQFPGLPGRPVRSLSNNNEEVLLVGMDSAGVFRLDNQFYQPSNNGVAAGSSVYGVTAKDQVLKTKQLYHYYYMATSTGLYRSLDLGRNWTLSQAGNFTAIY